MTPARAIATAALAALMLASAAAPACAGTPRALGARVIRDGDDRYTFAIDIAHNDDSWEHFVDRWEVVGKGGRVLATDYLYYPRIDENIGVRILRGIKVDPGTEFVIYRIHALGDGYGRDKLVRMPTAAKPDTGWQ